jgi:hypothetical protein
VETVLAEVARQVPSLLVLAWIVAAFLKALDGIERRSEAAAARTANALDGLRDHVASCPRK